MLERSDVYSIGWHFENKSGGMTNADNTPLRSREQLYPDHEIVQTANNLERSVPFMLTVADSMGKKIAQVNWVFDPTDPVLFVTITAALRHSTATFCAYDGERAAGMARLLGDGGMSFYIKDFAVRPEYQGKGVGRLLMEAIEAHILTQLQPGWAVSMELISPKGKEPFYEKSDFEQRPCDWDGAGMFKMVRK